MKFAFLSAVAIAAILVAVPAAADNLKQGGPATGAGACNPTVAAALGAWDAGMAAAEKFGEKATAMARDKGRDYLLPLLGIDPKSAAGQQGSGGKDAAGDVAREVEATRGNPERRAALCAAVTQAMDEAKGKAGTGLDALRRAIDGLRSTAPAPPAPAGTPKDELIRT